MNRSFRVAMLFVSLLLFLAITPFVVLYAIGYRLSPLDGAANPVGVLLLETIPRRADVYFQDTFIGRTPRAVPNIPPGTAFVSLRKDGYINWEKNVPINATLTSEFRHIRLFPKDPVRQTIRPNVQLFALSPSNRFIAVVEKNTTIAIINSAGESIVAQKALSFAPQKLVWSPNNGTVLALGARRAATVDITQPLANIVDIPQISAAAMIGWDASHPGRILYQTTDGVAVYTLATRTAEIIMPLTQAVASDESVIGLTAGTVAQYNLSGEFEATLLASAPVKVKQIVAAPSGSVALLTSDSALSVIENGQAKPVAAHVLEALWSPDGTALAFKTAPNELYMYNASNDNLPYIAIGAQNLILRLSRPFSQFDWYAGPNHMVYQAADEITITEMDTRDHATQYKVDTTNIGRSFPTATADGSLMYYLKKTPAGNALISVNLQPE